MLKLEPKDQESEVLQIGQTPAALVDPFDFSARIGRRWQVEWSWSRHCPAAGSCV